ncbi:MAG: biotin--[acetyl-CoA-carboxylase] ligase [Bacteroidales bacterium]|jgi:BirA family biotin operon repressor/biotin-[acetyl-CoA-carboxylase] ligase|nr:biotin--[acetyl-CoA-carboxylase] ligase [Bacteroidales bacterium]
MKSWEKIVNLDMVDSTNNYFSKTLKENKVSEGSIISTLFQSSGKGLGNNTWESEKGKNLICSLLLYPDFLPIDKNFLISKTISLGIVDYLKSKTNEIKIKWPNDIYINDKKIAGILIENAIKGSSINQCIVGIGLNLNQTQFISDAPNPVSLTQITDDIYSIEKELIKLREHIRIFYKKLKSGKYEEINEKYINYLYRFNEYFTYKSNNNTFKAKITGVNEFGHLQIINTNQEKMEFEFKEIEFVFNDQ